MNDNNRMGDYGIEPHGEMNYNGMGGLSSTNLYAPVPVNQPYPKVVSWGEQKHINRLVKEAERTMTAERLRTMLAESAMGNVACLAGLATHLQRTLPYGSKYYEAILRAYAKGAAEKIMEW